MKTELTIEESAKLVKLGINQDLASIQADIPYDLKSAWDDPNAVDILKSYCVFSLTDIIKFLPKEINGHPLGILWDSYCNEWQAVHIGLGNGCGDLELINALYQLLIKTIENKVYE